MQMYVDRSLRFQFTERIKKDFLKNIYKKNGARHSTTGNIFQLAFCDLHDIYKTTQSNVPEKKSLRTRRRENMKTHQH